MTLDEILASLFPDGHDVRSDKGVVLGIGKPCDPAAKRSSSVSRTVPPLASTRPSSFPAMSWILLRREAARFSSSWTATASA